MKLFSPLTNLGLTLTCRLYRVRACWFKDLGVNIQDLIVSLTQYMKKLLNFYRIYT